APQRRSRHRGARWPSRSTAVGTRGGAKGRSNAWSRTLLDVPPRGPWPGYLRPKVGLYRLRGFEVRAWTGNLVPGGASDCLAGAGGVGSSDGAGAGVAFGR